MLVVVCVKHLARHHAREQSQAKGLCRAHYLRARHYGAPLETPIREFEILLVVGMCEAPCTPPCTRTVYAISGLCYAALHAFTAQGNTT